MCSFNRMTHNLWLNMFFYSVTISYDNGQEHAAVVGLRFLMAKSVLIPHFSFISLMFSIS